MSESILPWIAAHLVDLAEEYGANIPSIKPFTRKKKVQLVEFLTYDPDEIIWARVSDKEYLIPIRFNREAVQEYTKLSGSRLTQHKTAIICISNFKPFLTRIPQGKGRLSQDKFLALECDSFSVLGSLGEAKFGNPRPLEANDDLREWSDGLKRDGGGGNCLRDRKREEVLKKALTTASASRIVVTKPTTSPSKQPARKKAPLIPISTARNGMATTSRTMSRSSPKIWQITKKSLFRRPPDDVGYLLASMKVDGEEDSVSSNLQQTNGDAHSLESPRKRRRISALLSSSPAASQSGSRSRSATPLPEEEWPASDRPRTISPLARSPPSLAPAKASATSSSHPRPPTPAQRIPRREARSMSPSNPPSPTWPKVVSKEYVGALPPSSPPLPSHITIAPETVLIPSPTISPPTHARREVTRKVPRPPQPIKSRPMADPIILAPNSDNSLSYSQSQSQSQSQSHSQFQSQSQSQSPSRKKIFGSSQPVILSQLSELARAHRRSEVAPQLLNPVDRNQIKEHLENRKEEDDERLNSTQARHFHGDQSAPRKSSVTHRAHAATRERRNLPTSQLSDQSDTDNDGCADEDPFNTGFASPSHGVDKESPSKDDLVDASLAVEPASTQPHPPHDGYPDVATVDGKSPQVIDMNQELDEDDAETHIDLFGASAPGTQEPHYIISEASLATTRRAAVAESALDEAHSRSTALISEEARISTFYRAKDGSLGLGPALDTGETHHDPSAWVLPSFLRPSKSKANTPDESPLVITTTNTKVTSTSDPINASTPHALAKSRLLNRQRPFDAAPRSAGTSHRKETSLSSHSSTSKNRSDEQQQASLRDDQNSDPYRRIQLSTETRTAPPQSSKRGRDTLSDDSLVRDKGRPDVKKRRLDKELVDKDLDGGVAKKQLARGFQADQLEKPMVKRLVAPLKLDGLLLEEQNHRLVTWLALTNTLRQTYRDRRKGMK